VAKRDHGPRAQTIEFEGIAFVDLIQDRPLDWPAPHRELLKNPSAADYVWRRLQYVLGLPNPHSFAPQPVTLTEAEQVLLQRFIDHTARIADTTLMSAKDSWRVSAPFPDVPPQLETEFSDLDVTTGFMALLRQCVADGEEASFPVLRRIVERGLHEAGDDASLETAQTWRRAHARLLNHSVEVLVQQRLIAEGRMPGELIEASGKRRSTVIADPAPPLQLLQTFWYADQLHFGEQHREALALIRRDPMQEAIAELAARRVGVELANFYLGYSVIAERVLSVAQPAARAG
jgi:hypothetical protein